LFGNLGSPNGLKQARTVTDRAL